jgi:hypothetical protein
MLGRSTLDAVAGGASSAVLPPPALQAFAAPSQPLPRTRFSIP